MIKFDKVKIRNNKNSIEEVIQVTIKDGKIEVIGGNNLILNSLVEVNNNIEIIVEDILIDGEKITKKKLINKKLLTDIDKEYNLVTNQLTDKMKKYSKKVIGFYNHENFFGYISKQLNFENYDKLNEAFELKFKEKIKNVSKINNTDFLLNNIQIENFEINKNNYVIKGKQKFQTGFTIKELVLVLVLIGFLFMISLKGYAASTASSDVSYSAPSGSGLGSNVQTALNNLYSKTFEIDSSSPPWKRNNPDGSKWLCAYLDGSTPTCVNDVPSAAQVCTQLIGGKWSSHYNAGIDTYWCTETNSQNTKYKNNVTLGTIGTEGNDICYIKDSGSTGKLGFTCMYSNFIIN